MVKPARDVPQVLTKQDLIKKISAAADVTREDADVVMDTILNTMVRTLRAGGKVEIRGFGSFRIRPRRARIGRNPKTGARVEVPAKNIPYFTPSQALREGVNAN